MPPKGRQRLVPPKDEVQRRWAALDSERRQALMTFVEPSLVDRVKSSMHALWEKQSIMHQLGIRLPAKANDDQITTSDLFKSAFMLTCVRCRPDVDGGAPLAEQAFMVSEALAMQAEFLGRHDFFEALARVLPDFLRPASPVRSPMPRARWKDIFAVEPSSISGMEQQLVRLVEQALWLMATDPAYAVDDEQLKRGKDGEAVEPPDAAGVDTSGIEALLEEEEAERARKEAKAKKQKKKRRPGSAVAAQARPAVVEEAEVEDDSMDAASSMPITTAGDDDDLPALTVDGSAGSLCLPTFGIEEEELDDSASQADESVGTGVFHTSEVGSSAPDAPGLPTGDSTPVAGFPRIPMRPSHSGMRSPPSSPAARQGMAQSSQLICYIWNHASQIDSNFEHLPRKAPNCVPTPDTTSSTPYPASRSSAAFSRGSWTPMAGICPSPSIAAVVKNTFVDIVEPDGQGAVEAAVDKAGQRPSRSMSPSLLRHMDNDWRYW
mmetsp:Transcript_48625/g.141705  ORF Transcript_48625/g.141705 Transcript_48625/m.141705 type:complete len:492 (-) Transcript_48625:278-1753(-)